MSSCPRRRRSAQYCTLKINRDSGYLRRVLALRQHGLAQIEATVRDKGGLALA